MNFGEPLEEDRLMELIRLCYQQGIRTFMTADVYGAGKADELLGRALADLPRDSYCLVGMVGHDFYATKRDGAKGFPRFTNLELRKRDQYGSYLRMATETSLERCGTDHFDLLLLHNPDSVGYSSDAVWQSLEQLKEAGLTASLGVAPGPANGFTLDIIQCFERFDGLVDWAMIILNPLEPWPGSLCLPAASKHQVRIITRVVDHGGLFHDDVKPGHPFRREDHRGFRPAGWVEAGCEKIDRMRPTAEEHRLTLLQLACLWNLSQPMVQCVVPTLIQESGTNSKPIEAKAAELAALPQRQLSQEECENIRQIGDNTGCMALKGGNPEHAGDALADRWSLTPELTAIGQRWGIQPDKDLVKH